MTGIRRGGETRFQFRINGYPGTDFPPAVFDAPLSGLRHWIRGESEEREEGAEPRPAATLPLTG